MIRDRDGPVSFFRLSESRALPMMLPVLESEVGGIMANFLLMGGSAGFSGINLDQIQKVIRDKASDTVTIYFNHDHTIILQEDAAKEFMDVLTRLKSDASLAVEAIRREKEAAAKSGGPKKPKPPIGGGKRSPWG